MIHYRMGRLLKNGKPYSENFNDLNRAGVES